MSNQKKPIFLYRAQTFESNSSSSHVLVINHDNINNIRVGYILNEDGNIIIDMTDQAPKGSWVQYKTTESKIRHITHMLITNTYFEEHKNNCIYTLKMFISILQSFTEANKIFLKWHDSQLLIQDGEQYLIHRVYSSIDNNIVRTYNGVLSYDDIERAPITDDVDSLLLNQRKVVTYEEYERWVFHIMNAVFDNSVYFEYSPFL